ncbi:MAG: polyphosphate polymerase domain-containing protein [Solobacterium sp.]|nr:polyphosphate polymerase domain-containing protein [Solobacterium sp.]
MTQMVFNRYEKKYLLTEKQYEGLLEAMKDSMHEDMYGLTSICNIYYDTSSWLLIRRSIEKTDYKEKLRLRSYGIPSADSMVFLEIKKKVFGIVNKRRVSMPLKEACEFVKTGINPHGEQQIFQEIESFLRRYPLRPALYLAYDRTAYVCEKDPDFRLTIDHRIRYRTEDVRLEDGDEGKELLPGNMYLLETKNAGATPAWFAGILASLKIRPVRFSKYGSIYKNMTGGEKMFRSLIAAVSQE